jgi:steroid delta-isomerase-like uncharacterized protein
MIADTALLDELYEAYNRHDPDAAAALYASEGIHEDVAHGRPKVGRDAIAGGLRHFFAAFPDARWDVHARLSGDAHVGASYVLTGTLQTDLGPFEATGQRLEIRGVQVLETAGGLISRSEDFWDASTFARQMKASPNTTHTGGAA